MSQQICLSTQPNRTDEGDDDRNDDHDDNRNENDDSGCNGGDHDDDSDEGRIVSVTRGAICGTNNVLIQSGVCQLNSHM